jgi:hypothetical protein
MAPTQAQFPLVRNPKSLLWIDCSGGLAVGIVVLARSPWLSTLYGIPQHFITALGAANLAYGTYSFSLARRTARPRAMLLLLVGANLTWAIFCAVASAYLASHASVLGLAHLLLEGAFVGGLGLLEWRYIDDLLTGA